MKHLPNFLTLMNLLCGSLAVALAFMGYPVISAFMILSGFVFDVLDGFTARILRVQSEIGKELDSLADNITFGLAPAAILFTLGRSPESYPALFGAGSDFSDWTSFLAFLLPVFAAIRLARFNLDTRQTSRFIGMPTPANGIMVLAIPMILHYQPDSFLAELFTSAWFVPGYAVIVSALMVSPIGLYSLKIKGLSWKQNQFTLLFAFGAVLLILLTGPTGVFLLIPGYLVYAIILNARYPTE